jgi:hypothetical protein
MVWTVVHTSLGRKYMGSSGSGSQTAMMVVWVILIVAAVGGAGVYALVRRRKAGRP